MRGVWIAQPYPNLFLATSPRHTSTSPSENTVNHKRDENNHITKYRAERARRWLFR